MTSWFGITSCCHKMSHQVVPSQPYLRDAPLRPRHSAVLQCISAFTMDRLLANHLDEVERGFDFMLTPHLDRRLPRLGVWQRNYVGRLMTWWWGAAEVGPNDHFLININCNWLRHSYHSSRMRVRDWLDNTLRAQEIMQQISHMLNSNKQFRLDDFFSLHISHIQDPGQEAGNQRIRKRTMAVEKLLHLKKSVL